ncbi:hypothetical protein ACHAXT_010220 [Thalassiosira profunda]
MASSGAPTASPILEEGARLRQIRSSLAELWQEEVQLYESGVLLTVRGDGSVVGEQPRNRPNLEGVVENERIFPYHTAVYPLLDAYDSIRDASSAADDVARPSPAPLPFAFNGHRRSRFAPRLDRHGQVIEELQTLVGHLPNSAWAVKRLMPRTRQAQFLEEEEMQSSDNPPAAQEEDEAADPIQIDAPNTRFWNILMDPVAGKDPMFSSNVSVPPVEEANDADAEQEDDNGEWEDVDEDEDTGDWEDVDEEEDEQNVGEGVPIETGGNAKDARDFAFLRWWQRAIVLERRGQVHEGAVANDSPKSGVLAYLFDTSPSATFILLRVLKHSLSDLQREFRLAQAVVLLVADWRLCDNVQKEEGQPEGEKAPAMNNEDGIECLRRLLTIVSSEYLQTCSGYCHEWHIAQGGVSDEDDEFEDADNAGRPDAPSHYCSDWWEFLGSLSTLLSCGIQCMSREHANVICAFVMEEINLASCSAGPTESGFLENKELSGKAYLKQNLFYMNQADYDSFGRSTDGGAPKEMGQLKINLLLTILSGLRQHAVSDKMRLVKLQDESNGTGTAGDSELSKTLASFQACTDAIVDIGERCLLRLPVNKQGRQLGGMVVRGLVEAYADSDRLTADRPLAYLAERMDGRLRSVIDPLRYGDAVTDAASNPLLDPSRKRVLNEIGEQRTVEQLIGLFQPPRDAQDVVRGLFMRDLVDLKVSGCGYGDFLTWCHLPLSPEPLLFDYVSNFPSMSREDADGGRRNEHWVIDEDDIRLDQGQLSARYDFTLLVFLRQWHSPWTPASHLSYSLPYRQAVSTLALCGHRIGVPSGITNLINSFLPRSWWPDDRRLCWCRDCQLDKLKASYRDKIRSRQSNWGSEEEKPSASNAKADNAPLLMTCQHCSVAMACSKEHLKYLHQDGHKRYCGLPPFQAPFGRDDNVLCKEVFGQKDETTLLDSDDDGGNSDDENDDDGSWESVDSNGEAEPVVQSRTDMIWSFFNDHSYKHQRRGL